MNESWIHRKKKRRGDLPKLLEEESDSDKKLKRTKKVELVRIFYSVRDQNLFGFGVLT